MSGGGSEDGRPELFVIAGPNGAGKTTFAERFLPKAVRGRQYLNADKIAAGLSPFAPETQNVRAGRLLIERTRELVAAGADFGFETTLAGRGYAVNLRRWRSRGYRVSLYFLALDSADVAVARVAKRVREGGHDVPEEDVRRRFREGRRNFLGLYAPLADAWWLYDSSSPPPGLIARSADGAVTVDDAEAYRRFMISAAD